MTTIYLKAPKEGRTKHMRRIRECHSAKNKTSRTQKKIPSLSYNLTNLHNLPRTWAHPSNPLSPTPTNYLKKGI